MSPQNRRARSQKPAPPPVADPRKQGMRAFTAGNFEGAIQAWSLLKQDDPQVQAALAEAHFRRALTLNDGKERIAAMRQAHDLAPQDVRYQYHLGMSLHRNYQPAEASACYREVLQRSGHWPGAALALALAELQQQRDKLPDLAALPGSTPAIRASLEPVQTLLRGDTPPPPGQAKGNGALQALWHGLGLLQAGETAAARDMLSADASLPAPAAQVRRFYYGVALARDGNLTQAVREWLHIYDQSQQKILWLQHNVEAGLIEVLQTHLEAGSAEEVADLARSAYQKGMRHTTLNPLLVRVLDAAAQQAACNNEWQQSVLLWEDARQLVSSIASLGSPRLLLHNLALAYEALEEWMAAAEMWRTMLRTRPRKTKHASEEEKAADPMAYTDEQWAWIRQRVITCYRQAGAPGEAVKVFKQAIKNDPHDLDMRVQLADALLANGQEQACVNELERILDIDPKHVDAHLRMAEVHAEGGNWGIAEHSLRVVLDQQPEREDVRRQIAKLMISRGNHLHNFGYLDAAEKIFKEGRAFAPSDYEFPLNLARVAIDRNNVDEAGSLIEQSLELGADNPKAYIFAIDCWAVADQVDKVQEVLARAEASITPSTEFYIDLARVLLTHSMPSSPFASMLGAPPAAAPSDGPWMALASEVLEKAIAQRPDDPRVRLQLASELLPLNLDMALEHAQAGVNLAPEEPGGLILLGIIQGLLEQDKEAKKTLRDAARFARKKGLTDVAAYADRIRQSIGPFFRMSLQMEMMGVLDEEDDLDDEDLFW